MRWLIKSRVAECPILSAGYLERSCRTLFVQSKSLCFLLYFADVKVFLQVHEIMCLSGELPNCICRFTAAVLERG
jgi:hypothetical protein